MPTFWAELRKNEQPAARLLPKKIEVIILTASRRDEARLGRWGGTLTNAAQTAPYSVFFAS